MLGQPIAMNEASDIEAYHIGIDDARTTKKELMKRDGEAYHIGIDDARTTLVTTVI